uniref:Phage tail collar domain-containing protein n=1 Tax=viral metagenome TaxID=1070528 RepID=A0A6H1ZY69_9ZZZZ
MIKNTGAQSNRPKYGIVIWTGTLASIPAGYVLCDGNNGTPDLRDYFIKGALDSGELSNTGGSAIHTHTPSSHNHTQDQHSHYVTLDAIGSDNSDFLSQEPPVVRRNHSHSATLYGTATNQATTITCSTNNGEPEYYKVAYIMQNRDLDLTGANLLGMLI